MVNHGCTLRDFHMVILEEIEDDEEFEAVVDAFENEIDDEDEE